MIRTEARERRVPVASALCGRQEPHILALGQAGWGDSAVTALGVRRPDDEQHASKKNEYDIRCSVVTEVKGDSGDGDGENEPGEYPPVDKAQRLGPEHPSIESVERLEKAHEAVIPVSR